MRKIVVLSMVTLDGVIQSPGGRKEDTSGGFTQGGWVAPLGDDLLNKAVAEELQPADYLLGRKTFEIWANYWPDHGDLWPWINEGTKYVFSRKMKKNDPLVTGWEHSKVIRTVADIKKLKSLDLVGSKKKDIHVWGSSKLVPLLLKNDLVDELRLKIYPILLGKGKKLFGEGVVPAAFKLTETVVTTKGVILATYKRAGKVKRKDVG